MEIKDFSFFPKTINLELTSRCNLSCNMCLQSKGLSRKRGDISKNTFLEIIGDLKEWHENVNALTICGIGEPLLHKRFLEFLNIFDNTFGDIRLELITNGTLLDKRMIKNILETSISKISISLDSFSKESYFQIKGKNFFGKMLNNIKSLLKGAAFTKTQIQINMLHRGDNNDEIREALIYFNRYLMPKDTIYSRRVKTLGGRINLRAEKKNVVHGYNSLKKEGVDISKYLIEKACYKSIHRVPCHQAFTFTMILHNGDAVPCCVDNNADMVMGNVNENSLYDIWFSPAYIAFRRSMAHLDFVDYPLCVKCQEWEMGLY